MINDPYYIADKMKRLKGSGCLVAYADNRPWFISSEITEADFDNGVEFLKSRLEKLGPEKFAEELDVDENELIVELLENTNEMPPDKWIDDILNDIYKSEKL
ncbi:hypothetical protein [Lactobacillus sp. PV034]|uniref:hypothetical protein n=1 Tax=Lactobacillus sp. PV034 TaxID=2594495 RepID=UPI0022403443|nr:hypothetical protein [Lactobacillus sp. PV034]QNQ80811.1 hypothetical protein FP432_04200 [Lactobacillus sp. PV034]